MEVQHLKIQAWKFWKMKIGLRKTWKMASVCEQTNYKTVYSQISGKYFLDLLISQFYCKSALYNMPWQLMIVFSFQGEIGGKASKQTR